MSEENTDEAEQSRVLALPDSKELHNIKRQAFWKSIKEQCAVDVYLFGDDQRVKLMMFAPGTHKGVLVASFDKGRIKTVNPREAMLGEMGLLAALRDALYAEYRSVSHGESPVGLDALTTRVNKVNYRLDELRKTEFTESEKSRLGL